MSDGNNINDWDPELYLKYRNERTQPSMDLVSKINITNPARIIDIGCGPGNSTDVLRQRWPHSNITGLDNSPEMINKAKIDYPGLDWILSDILSYKPGFEFNIVFSNATIQWIPKHHYLINKLYEMVGPGGALAVQIPQFNEMPVGKSIEYIVSKIKWRELTKGCSELFTYHEYNFYYNTLLKFTNLIQMWETSYIHVLDSHQSILEWIKSTALKPYLESLNNIELKNEFENEILNEIRINYPAAKNGNILFPFKRLFFIAYK